MRVRWKRKERLTKEENLILPLEVGRTLTGSMSREFQETGSYSDPNESTVYA